MKYYFGGKFNLSNDKNETLPFRLKDDYRSRLLGDPSKLAYANDNLTFGHNNQYVGCFYCEKASNGKITSTDCNEVVSREMQLIRECDVFVAVFGDETTNGTISELIYATSMDKKIIIFDKKRSTKSEFWFPIVMSKQMSDKVVVLEYDSEDEIIEYFKNVNHNRKPIKYKEFEMILSDYSCNRDCPYCTAKITKWEQGNDKLHRLKQHLQMLKDSNVTFKYFIFCGNGEPSLQSYETIKYVNDVVKSMNMFDDYRFQTSGAIFGSDKFNLVSDWLFEITRVDLDYFIDAETLCYVDDYTIMSNFKSARVRLNYVFTKRYDFQTHFENIKKHIEKFSCIKTVSIKTLNPNTRSDDTDNKYSKWILESAHTKSSTDDIVKFMNTVATENDYTDSFFDRYEWDYNDITITLYAKRFNYGISNIVFYRGELVDYHLNNIILK